MPAVRRATPARRCLIWRRACWGERRNRMKSEVRAASFCELTELLFEGAWDESLKRFRSPFAFRGLSSAAYPLKTSLMRLRGPYSKVEGHLIRNFAKYARRSVESADS